ncbi:terminase small subunit [Desulfovibrio sp. OttesenSCG-928-G15]|nr:terminase small subunit [Desulfovibrio sp. OttesenSCG-928-G15]
MAQLSKKQAVFVQEYLIDLNATQAAIRAGYSKKRADAIGHENLRKPEIAEAVRKAMEARNERTEISQDRVLEELACLAFGDLRDAVSWGPDGVVLKSSDTLTPEQAAAISEVSETVTKDGGSTRIKRHDKGKALELLMRHMGMLNDKLNLSGQIDISALEKARERAKQRI